MRMRTSESVPRRAWEGYSLSALARAKSTDRPTSDFVFDAIVVLGCRVAVDLGGRLRAGPLARRVDAAALAFARRARPGTLVVVSGGRHWDGLVEADVMARELVWRGVPHGAITRERCSLSTRDNAHMTAQVLARRGLASAAVVTCHWHLPRALALFRAQGCEVQGWPAYELVAPRAADRIWRTGREQVLRWVDAPPWRARRLEGRGP